MTPTSNSLTTPVLAIVVISYNSTSYLPVCLESLLSEVAAYPANVTTVKVAVVENGSDHSSRAVVQKLAQTRSNLQWLQAPANLGYAGGANFGWQRLGQANIYIVLNPDMRFCRGWLSKLVAPFERGPQIGVVGCKLLDENNHIQHAGGLVQHGTALGQHFGAGEADDGRWDEGTEVEFVTGAALAIRGELLNRLGGFDARFFPGYYEDVDLCRRVRQAGYKIWYEPQAVAYHYEGGTFGRSSGYYRALHRNRLRFVLKNLPARQLFFEFVPAERTRLKGMLASADRRAGEAVYRVACLSQVEQFSTSKSGAAKDGAAVLKDELGNYSSGQELENLQVEQLEKQLTEVKTSWKVEEKPFRSGLPLVATLREKFNSISTKWYVRPILQQQVDYNGAVARSLETLGQLVAGRDTSRDIQYVALASRLTTLEERLERIENLLEKIAQSKS